MKARLGLLICHSDNYFAFENNIPEICTAGLKKITDKENVDLIIYDAIKDGNSALEAEQFFKEKGIDYLLILTADFSTGDIMLSLENYDIPMGVWAVEDPKNVGDIQLNSTVSANLFISIAQRKYKEKKAVKWFYGSPESNQFKARMQTTCKAIRAYHAWNHKKIGILGDVAPTFFNLENNLDFESNHGLQFVRLTMQDLIDEVNELTEEDIEGMKKEILNSANDTSKLPLESLNQGAKVLKGLCNLVDKYNIASLAASCWPDFQDEFSIVPCVPFTLLGKLKGVPVACEGDVGGAVSLMVIYEISQHMPTLMDLTSIHSEDNKLLLWHCGIGSYDLAPKEHVEILPHPMLDRRNPNRKLMGLSYNYVLKPCEATLFRYSNNHKVFSVDAEILKDDKGFTGTRGYISSFESDSKPVHVDDILETLMSNGVEHHIILGQTHCQDALREWAHLMKLDWIEIEKYKNYL